MLKMTEPDVTVVVTARDGRARAFLLGDTIFGNVVDLIENECGEAKMNQTVVFTGHSDDVVLVAGVKGGDEFDNCGNHDESPHIFRLGPVEIYCRYNRTWSFAVGLAHEGAEWPGWATRLSQEHEYSMRLEIDVPNGVVLQQDQ